MVTASIFNGNYASQQLRFVKSRFGNPNIAWGKYVFVKKLTRKEKTWWECTNRKTHNCRCMVVTKNDRLIKLLEPIFSLSQRGNLVVQIGEWRFNKHATWGSKVRWTCIKKKSGCTASITTIDNVIVKTLGKHNH